MYLLSYIRKAILLLLSYIQTACHKNLEVFLRLVSFVPHIKHTSVVIPC